MEDELMIKNKYEIASLYWHLIPLSISIGLIFIIVVRRPWRWDFLSLNEWWALACLAFVIFWWVIYHLSPWLHLPTLRTFLDTHSLLRRPLTKKIQLEVCSGISQSSDAKAISGRASQAIYIAAISLFLLIIFSWQKPSEFQKILQPASALFGALSILFMSISTEILDTVFNIFTREATSTSVQPRYNALVKRFLHAEGARIAFSGYAAFIVFILLSFSFLYPSLAGIGTGLLVFLGTPYWFGCLRHKITQGVEEIFWHPIILWIGRLLGMVFWLVTFIIVYAS